MEFDQKPAPNAKTTSTIADSMAAIDHALAELVPRIEQEIAERGGITRATASELRSLRVGAEHLLAD